MQGRFLSYRCPRAPASRRALHLPVIIAFDQRIETVLVLLAVLDNRFDGHAAIDSKEGAVALMVSREARFVEGLSVGLNPGHGQWAILIVFEEDEVRRWQFFASVAVAARCATFALGIPVAERCATLALGIAVAGLSAALAFGGDCRGHGFLLCQAKFDSRSPTC